MKIKAFYEKKKYSVEAGAKATAADVLKKIGINPEMVIVSKNGKFVPDTEEVSPRDKIEILKVVSGG